MPTVQFLPMDTTVEIAEGTSLLEAARIADIEIESECGGAGTCGNCIVRILSGNADYEDRGFLDGNQIDQGFVLACLTTVTASDLIIEIC